MTKYTQKQLRELVAQGIAEDVTHGNNDTRREIIAQEGYLDQIGYACGRYGCSGALFRGHNSGKLYAITARTMAIFIFT